MHKYSSNHKDTNLKINKSNNQPKTLNSKNAGGGEYNLSLDRTHLLATNITHIFIALVLFIGLGHSQIALAQSTDHTEILTASERTALLDRFEIEADQAIDASSILDSTKQSYKMNIDAIRTRLEGMTITHATPAIQTLFNLPPNDQCVTGTSTFANCRDAVIVAAGVVDNLFTINGINLMVADRQQLSEANLNTLNEVQVGGTPPVFTSSTAVSAAENQVSVITVAATDADGDNAAIRFTVTGGADVALFSIVADTGVLTFITAPNFESPEDVGADNIYQVIVTATDEAGDTTAQNISITVTNVNEAPIVFNPDIIFDQTATVGEALELRFLGVAFFSDVDDGDTLTYSAAPLPDGMTFTFDADNNAVTFSGTPTTAGTTVVVITATDNNGLTATYEFNIVVAPVVVNNDPVFTSSTAVSAAENQVSVITVAATDADGANGAIRFTVTGGADVALFSIVADTGVLTFITAPNFESPEDVGADNIYQVVVTATDEAGDTTAQTISITVTNVNEDNISIADQSRSIAEDANTGANVGVVLVATGNPTGFAITAGNEASKFAIDNSGQITLANTLDFETTPSYSLTVTITKTDAADQTAIITIAVTDVNDAPVFTSSETANAQEDQTAVITVTATDADGDNTAIRFTVTGGDDVALFNIVTDTGVLTFINAPDFEIPTDDDGNNIYELVVTATDDAGGTSEQTLTITVTSASETAVSQQLNAEVLSVVTQAVIANTNLAITNRIESAISGRLSSQNFNLNGQSSIAGVFKQLGTDLESNKLDLKRWLTNSEFSINLDSLKAFDDGSTKVASNTTIWGSGSYKNLSDNDNDSDLRWDGDIWGAQLGADTKINNNLLAGAALSWSEGNFDYSGAGDNNSKGEYEYDSFSIHPYLNYKVSDDFNVWATLGYGTGEIIIKDEVLAKATSDINLYSLTLGTKLRLSNIGNSTSKVYFKSDISTSQTDIKGATGIAKDTINSQRLRLLLESKKQYKWNNNQATQSIELGARYDKGDGKQNGTGIEIAAGLGVSNPDNGLTIESKIRTLVAADYNEWGANVSIKLQTPSKYGLALSLSPSIGKVQSSSDAMFNKGVDSLPTAQQDQDLSSRLNGELSYTMPLLPMMNKPLQWKSYTGMSLSSDQNRYYLGSNYKLGNNISLNLETARREFESKQPQHQIDFKIKASF